MKRIVIAPSEEHRNLYSLYRKDNPFCDVKFYSLESFVSEANYQSDDSALLYLIKEHKFDYSLANEFLKYIKRIKIDISTNQKIQRIIDLKNELLSKNLLTKNEYFDYEISHAKIDIYFYSEKNKELLNIIKDKDYEFIHQSKKDNPPIYNFSNNVDELSFVFNKISELISSGVKASDISIFGLSDKDELAFERLKQSYKLNFNGGFTKNYLSKIYVTRFINEVSVVGVDKALEAIGEIDDETYPEFKIAVEKYRLEGITNKVQSDLYSGVFKKMKLASTKYVDAVNVVSKPIAKENGYLFIVNFVQGKYPPISRDNEFLSDVEKAEIGINTSEEENAANLEQYLEYLWQNANIFVSYSNHNYSEKHYASPLLSRLGIKEGEKIKIHHYFSKNEAELSYANLLDLRRNYLDKNPLLKSFQKSGLKLPYRTYDYRYSFVNHFFDEKVLTLSYSQVKTYCQCKFRYYLDKVLGLDESETTFNQNIGKLAHAIYQRIDEDKSFDELYDEEIAKIEPADKYDWVYLRRIKEEIRRSYEYIKSFESRIENPEFYREVKQTISLDPNTKLLGIFDKLITFGDGYFAIVDYKSGYEEFKEADIQYGLSLQLPTYALIAKESGKFNNLQLAGLFIQRFVVSKNISCKVSTEQDEKPLLRGLFLDEPTVMVKLDSTISKDPSEYIYSCKLTNAGAFNSKRNK